MRVTKRHIIFFFLFVCWFAKSQTNTYFHIDIPAKFAPIEKALYEGDIEKARNLCNQKLITVSSQDEIGMLHLLRSEALFLLDQLDSSVLDLEDAASSLPRTDKIQAYIKNKLAYIHFQKNELDMAIQYYKTALPLANSAASYPITFEILSNLSIIYSNKGQHEDSFNMLKQALNIAHQLRDQEKKKSVLNNIATNYYSIGQYDSAAVYFSDLIELKSKSKDQDYLVNDMGILGKLLMEQGKYLLAQKQLIAALKISEAQADTFQIMTLCTDIAKVYAAQSNWENTFEYAYKAQQLAEKKAFQLIIAENLKIQGKAHLKQKDIDLAKAKYKSALILYEELNNALKLADVQVELSNLFQEEKDYQKAKIYVERALNLRQNLAQSDPSGTLRTTLLLSELELKLGNFKRSISLSEDALATSQKMNSLTSERKAHQLLTDAYAKDGSYKKALSAHQAYTQLNETILSIEKTKDLNEIEIRYETDKKDQQLLRQEAEIKAKETEIQQRNNLLLLLLILLALGLFSIGLLLSIYRKNKQLHEQKLHFLQKQQETQRLRAVIEGEEKERKRIAQDLHDGLGATLATVKMRINAIENDIPTVNQNNSYQKAEELLDDACKTVRQLSHHMVPGILENYGLEYAITDMCEAISKTQQIEVDFIPFGLEHPLPESLRVTVYRIIQELLRNIVKHAEASEVIVQLTIENNTLNLTVEDDGIGFQMDAPDFKRGLGLDNIYSRVAFLEGKVQIDSIVGEGSSFIIDIPNLNHA